MTIFYCNFGVLKILCFKKFLESYTFRKNESGYWNHCEWKTKIEGVKNRKLIFPSYSRKNLGIFSHCNQNIKFKSLRNRSKKMKYSNQ